MKNNDINSIGYAYLSYLTDNNPEETNEWIESLAANIQHSTPDRTDYLLRKLLEFADKRKIDLSKIQVTDYVNSIPKADEPTYPGDEKLERSYRKYLRWNAAMVVHRAQRPGVEVGGHLSSYASCATLYEVGLNHFFKGNNHPDGADQIFFQGHSSPGIYARAFLEGRLSADDLDGYRQQFSHPGKGLPSYPHPRQLPDFWQFPTVSMGLGPMNAIYQARFNRYLANRGIKDTSKQFVWAFLGDGEMDEPESRGFLHVAAQEELDNLVFVVNCNLQRLDGPVRGNGKIVQELEANFRGAGWNVIKVLWGREWDQLFAKDTTNSLVNLMNTTLDGDFQTFTGKDGAYIRENFFGRSPETAKLVADLSDEDIWEMKRGGNDYQKVYAAYNAAVNLKNGKPTVILAQTVKGYSLGKSFEGKNATHQMKKMTLADLKSFRDRLEMPVTDQELEENPYLPPYLKPAANSPELTYLLDSRKALGGFLPERRNSHPILAMDNPAALDLAEKGSGKQKVATTMALVRLFKDLLKDKNIGSRIVPIIPDEARTFGMESWFHNLKIYNPKGQKYTAVDADLMLTYREATDGQILHEGINETGCTSSFIAAGTSYATHDIPMIPLYIFYSMFGFQRSGDNFWAAADQMARGFVVGATAGRTTLVAEGLQHADGHSLLLAHTNPAVISYDPAFGYELAAIIKDALVRMYGKNSENLIYYLTVYNQPISQPAQPDNIELDGITKGIYLFNNNYSKENKLHVNLLASGIGMQAALAAQKLLEQDWKVSSSIYSVTSWGELNRQALANEKLTAFKPELDSEPAYVTKVLSQTTGPYIAISDWVTDVPALIERWVPGTYTILGTDGFGVSDTRSAARRHFATDEYSLTFTALKQLVKENLLPETTLTKAIKQYELDKPIAELTEK